MTLRGSRIKTRMPRSPIDSLPFAQVGEEKHQVGVERGELLEVRPVGVGEGQDGDVLQLRREAFLAAQRLADPDRLDAELDQRVGPERRQRDDPLRGRLRRGGQAEGRGEEDCEDGSSHAGTLASITS